MDRTPGRVSERDPHAASVRSDHAPWPDARQPRFCLAHGAYHREILQELNHLFLLGLAFELPERMEVIRGEHQKYEQQRRADAGMAIAAT